MRRNAKTVLMALLMLLVLIAAIGCGEEDDPAEESSNDCDGFCERIDGCGFLGDLGFWYVDSCLSDCGSAYSTYGECVMSAGSCSQVASCFQNSNSNEQKEPEIKSPDRYTVEVHFQKDVGSDAGKKSSYAINSEFGGLTIEDVDYDDDEYVATIETAKQKLGVKYTLIFNSGEDSLVEEFYGIDSMTFYAVDYANNTTGDRGFQAYRAGVSENLVIYIEAGMNANNIDETLEEFEEKIFPLESDYFTTPNDMDGNGKILMLGCDLGSGVGGYYWAGNEYDDSYTMMHMGYHSNEMEMFYINLKHDSSFDWRNVMPHEYQHLLYNSYSGRSNSRWTYHNEGLAELAVHLVYGSASSATRFFSSEGGLSLVDWEGGISQYSMAYLFWLYVAGQADGIETFRDIFALKSGDPSLVDDYFQDLFGKGFAQVQADQFAALWIQKSSGTYSYNGLYDFSGKPSTVDSGTSSIQLPPYSAAYFLLDQNSVSYPGTEGSHIVYYGINGSDSVDDTEPFDIKNGVLLIHNANMAEDHYPTEHSGPDISSVAIPPLSIPQDWLEEGAGVWFDPPSVLDPNSPEMARWRKMMREHGFDY